MIYTMEYYGNNDYRDYLAHHGVKGMKWGKHLFGLLGGNYRDQYKTYSSQASALKKSSGAINRTASNASSYASKKKEDYENARSKSSQFQDSSKNVSARISNISNISRMYNRAYSGVNDNRNAAKKTRASEMARANEVRKKEMHRREQAAYFDKLHSLAPSLYDSKKKEPIKIRRPSSYDSKDRVGAKIYDLTLHDIAKKTRDAYKDKYGAAYANMREYDKHKKAQAKANKDVSSNNQVKKLVNKALGKGFESLGKKYEERLSKASNAMDKRVAKAKSNYELASTVSKKANDLADSNKSAIGATDKKASEAKSKWEKSIAYRVDTVLKRFTGKLSSVGANIINRGRSIIDRFLRRKKKNS